MPERLPGSATMLHCDVATGVHWLECARTNMYLIRTDNRVLVVDAGLPRMWPALQAALDRIGSSPSDIDGIVLTHGHFDHVGLALRAHREWQIPVWVHPRDRRLAAHPYRYRTERNRFRYPLTHPAGVPNLARMIIAGAAAVRGIEETTPVDVETSARRLLHHDVRVLETPGHTDGHIALHVPGRDVLLVGDTLVTFDPYKNSSGPQIVAGAATADSATNLRSLQVLAETGAGLVLTGHGDPWTTGVAAAVAHARRQADSDHQASTPRS